MATTVDKAAAGPEKVVTAAVGPTVKVETMAVWESVWASASVVIIAAKQTTAGLTK